jgi:hypothetical protein
MRTGAQGTPPAKETAMLQHSLSALIATAAFAAAAPASGAAYDPVYITDGQYTATLLQHAHLWRLQPLRGDEVEVVDHSPDCGSASPLPEGLWYVSQDEHGRPQLVAPSVTALPAGFPQHVALLACGEKSNGGFALFVPAVALNWINDFVGTVLIDD